MKIARYLIRGILILLILPLSYLFFSLVITFIPVSSKPSDCRQKHSIYIASSNMIHSDFILPVELLSTELRKDLVLEPEDRFIAFGWGDKNFYVNTPTWGDLTATNVFLALFTAGPSAVHVIRLPEQEDYWLEIKLCDSQLEYINQYINRKFQKEGGSSKIHFASMSYTDKDDFYFGNGSLSLFFTCNSWVNEGLKFIGKPACLWTPYSFWMVSKYK